MTAVPCQCESATLADLPQEDVIILAPGTVWRVPAARLVLETGWDLAVLMSDEPQVITARSVYLALSGPDAATSMPAWLSESFDGMSAANSQVRL